MKRYRIQRAAVIAVCACSGFLQIFYYSIVRVCFPEFLKQNKTLADGISIGITVVLAVSLYLLVTVILKANHHVWALRQQMADRAYVRLPSSPEEPATPETLLESIRARSRKDGWGQLEDVQICGETYQLLIVKGTGALYVNCVERLTRETLVKAQRAILENVDAVGLRKRQDAVLCFCCETVEPEALELAKSCECRGKTCVYSAVLEAATQRGYCLITDRRGRVQDTACQKMLAKLVLGYAEGKVPQGRLSEEVNPEAGKAEEALDNFHLYQFWKSTR